MTDGSLVWARQFGTTQDDVCEGVAVWGALVVVTGYTLGSLGSPGAQGFSDTFVAAFNTSGGPVWRVQFGSPGIDNGHDIAADSTGVYVAGLGSSTAATVVKLSWTDGSRMWTQVFDASVAQRARAITLTRGGSLVVAGTGGLGMNSAFVAMVNSTSGGVQWLVRDADLDDVYSVAVAPTGAIYAAVLLREPATNTPTLALKKFA